MKIRSIETINNWANDVGFEIQTTKSDKLGYYSVTSAKKQINSYVLKD